MHDLIVLNIVAIVAVTILGAIFQIPIREAPRWFCAIWCGWGFTCLTGLAWVVYVAVHFIGKYW